MFPFTGLNVQLNLQTQRQDLILKQIPLMKTPLAYLTDHRQETRQTYEVLLSFIHEALGDQPQDVLAGAVDEVLVTLKNDKISSIEKKIEIEAILGSLDEERKEENLQNHYVVVAEGKNQTRSEEKVKTKSTLKRLPLPY